jgi:hypothetical protein
VRIKENSDGSIIGIDESTNRPMFLIDERIADHSFYLRHLQNSKAFNSPANECDEDKRYSER